MVGGAPATRFSKIQTKARDLLVDMVRLLDPRRRKTVHPQQMMGHPQARVFIWIAVERYRFAVVREIIELASLECFPDFSFGDEFPVVHRSPLTDPRKTECGAKRFVTNSAVRAVPFALFSVT